MGVKWKFELLNPQKRVLFVPNLVMGEAYYFISYQSPVIIPKQFSFARFKIRSNFMARCTQRKRQILFENTELN